MKIIFLFSTAALGVFATWPLLLAADDANLTQPFTAAPQVAIYSLDE